MHSPIAEQAVYQMTGPLFHQQFTFKILEKYGKYNPVFSFFGKTGKSTKFTPGIRLTLFWSGVVLSALASINEVNQRQSRLVLRWVSVSGFNSRCVTFIPVCNQPPRSTQSGHPFAGRRNEYQPKVGDALRPGVGLQARNGSCVGCR